MKSVWEERAVPKEWVDAVIVAIPKNLESSEQTAYCLFQPLTSLARY